jgi:hypothetical protein
MTRVTVSPGVSVGLPARVPALLVAATLAELVESVADAVEEAELAEAVVLGDPLVGAVLDDALPEGDELAEDEPEGPPPEPVIVSVARPVEPE